MRVELSVFFRLCLRCREIMLEAGAPQVLVDVYQTTGQPLETFSASMQTVKQARKRVKDANVGRASMLAEMDKLFRVARSAVGAIVPTTVLPETLKAQPTDTDKRDAIQELKSTIEGHAGAAWADNLLQGEFGQKAAAAIQQLTEYVEAGNALQKAQADRASAFGPGWSAFVKYKRLVHATLGSSSRQYQGLRVRKISAGSGDAEEGEGEEVETEEGEGEEVEAKKVEAKKVEAKKVEPKEGGAAAPESMAVASAP